MEPFSLSNIVNFINSRLDIDTTARPKARELANLLDKAENHIKSNHIRQFSKERLQIAGFVDPSYGKVKNKHQQQSIKSYHVQMSILTNQFCLYKSFIICFLSQIDFDENEGPKSAICLCPEGNFICSHATALMLFAKMMLSRTDFTSVWSRPKDMPGTGSEKIGELWATGQQKALHSPIKSSEFSSLSEMVSAEEQFGLHWLLQKEPDQPVEFVAVNARVVIDSILTSSAYISAHDKVEFLLDSLKLTDEEVTEVEIGTRGQRTNDWWLRARKNRLTASNFGIILDQVQRRSKNSNYTFTSSLFKTLNQEYSLGGVKSIGYGINHEKDAVQTYSALTEAEVNDAGFSLHTNGFLGASPDGVTSTGRLLEIKCPFSFRNSSSLDEVITNKLCCLVKLGTKYDLKKTHNYFHQIQGQLHICKKHFCDFVYWTPQWCEVITVEKDPTWKKNLGLLEDFYKNVYLQQLIK